MKEPFIDFWNEHSIPSWPKRLLAVPSYNFLFDLYFNHLCAPVYRHKFLHKLLGKTWYPQSNNSKDFFDNTVFQIMDIPDYLKLEIGVLSDSYQSIKIRQYPGFMVDLRDYKSLDEFLLQQLSTRNRKNLRSKQRKLESDADIRYCFYHGEIEKSEYDRIFDTFYQLLKKRFVEKEMFNRNLMHWKYYYELAYPMILNKQALLFVIYDKDKPITITLNFLYDQHLFSYIQTYDIDYSQYNMGDISMVKHLQWCLENQIQIFDLSKGENDYKLKWSNHRYEHFYHLFYKAGSIHAFLKAQVFQGKLRLAQYLRDKGILGKLFQYDRFFFKRFQKKVAHHDWKAPE
ncbi:acetyltransferase (GNAT) family protein [Zeaxanthinibacter enoshimensis]|uniref:Acetyltransferase (GNAT) family protein n=2 Tax=Zeaxanthinibacter enoshimensis TaxID=392009 RepID=A0A4R6TNH6_9FLAO|nr:acetyltransferase (GNAT) family protein [Zeaxanthinibacter enoshimensis]